MLVGMIGTSISISTTEVLLGNMFESNPDLVISLRTQGIEHLVYVGLQTDYCVRASILGAIASGFKASKITLLRGAHSTYDNSSTGKSYQEVKADVEKRLADLGVSLQDWNTFAL
jgi:nicotinamidase-related amidase